MRASDLIQKKRDAQELTREEIFFLIDRYTRGEIPDYQMSAWLMAVYWRGMSPRETSDLTEAMLQSGQVLDLSRLSGPKVDKHSTGGVGDKTSLVLAPAVAATGIRVPMISGRGLGHTGGTLDKLEAIPGFNVRLSLAEFVRLLDTVGVALIGQTEEIAPADKKLYALRDVTATVESIPLITSSILSKKLAEGIESLVLDVKVGSGAFMKDLSSASALADSLVTIGRRMGKRVVALLTAMDQPLGQAIGNALEVAETFEVLRGRGPDDLRGVCEELAGWMIVLGGRAQDLEEGKRVYRKMIDSGAAAQKMREIIQAQGGDPKTVDEPGRLPQAQHRHEWLSPHAGYLERLDAEKLGRAAMLLGAGRERVEDRIDPAVGLVVHKKVGEPVERNEVLATVYYNDPKRLEGALALMEGALAVGAQPPAASPLIHKTLA
ncbi:MAG: thymidine phosphorylase [Acidobacteria bacterium]|nr:thymidine phosphorylase [Acidobacteriota bacterium]